MPEAELALSPDPASAGAARRFVMGRLDEWACPALVDAASLLVSELVANAVLHARTDLRLRVAFDDSRLRVEVYDRSTQLPVRKSYSTSAGTGRGLLLVDQLADQWGTTPTDAGKVVWFELDATDAIDPLAAFDFDAIDPLDDGPTGGGGGAPTLDHGDVPGRGPFALAFVLAGV